MSFFSELKLICGTLDRRMFQSLILLLTVSAFTTMTTPCLAFTQSIRSTSQRELPKTVRKYEPESAAIARLNLCKDRDECDDDVLGRRKWLSSSLVAATTLWGSSILPAMAEGTEATATVVEMKDFVDPVGYFSIRIPKYFFALRRSAKGDLPDPKTGQGRRGSSIFTAGDMRKAELVAVERYVGILFLLLMIFVLLFDHIVLTSSHLIALPPLSCTVSRLGCCWKRTESKRQGI